MVTEAEKLKQFNAIKAANRKKNKKGEDRQEKLADRIQYQLVSVEFTVGGKFLKFDGIKQFEEKVNLRLGDGWVPLGGPTRTAICRGRLTVEEHTITQALVKYP